jgi:TfoX/Sxy family transcriptional regulator of competence genes
MTMRYYQMPDEAYEDPDAFRPWFRLAKEAAERAPLAKKKASR